MSNGLPVKSAGVSLSDPDHPVPEMRYDGWKELSGVRFSTHQVNYDSGALHGPPIGCRRHTCVAGRSIDGGPRGLLEQSAGPGARRRKRGGASALRDEPRFRQLLQRSSRVE